MRRVGGLTEDDLRVWLGKRDEAGSTRGTRDCGVAQRVEAIWSAGTPPAGVAGEGPPARVPRNETMSQSRDIAFAPFAERHLSPLKYFPFHLCNIQKLLCVKHCPQTGPLQKKIRLYDISLNPSIGLAVNRNRILIRETDGLSARVLLTHLSVSIPSWFMWGSIQGPVFYHEPPAFSCGEAGARGTVHGERLRRGAIHCRAKTNSPLAGLGH